MKKHIQKIILFLVIMLNANLLFAQSHSVSGKITDGESGLGIPGATVLESGTLNGTTTDIDGRFMLKVASPSSILKFPSLDFKPKKFLLIKEQPLTLHLFQKLQT